MNSSLRLCSGLFWHRSDTCFLESQNFKGIRAESDLGGHFQGPPEAGPPRRCPALWDYALGQHRCCGLSQRLWRAVATAGVHQTQQAVITEEFA